MRRLLYLAFIIVATLAAALWLEHRATLTLPKPTGTFAVGRSVAEWAGANRDLLIWMWYPATNSIGSDESLPAATRAAIEKSRPGVINFLTRDLAEVHGNARWNAEMLQRSWPVLL